MLSISLDEAPAGGPRARLASATRGVVFFATPHFGSRLASLGLKLRHVPGAAPAPAVHHLAPGPHLELLNRRLRRLHDAGALLGPCSVHLALSGAALWEGAGAAPKPALASPLRCFPSHAQLTLLPSAPRPPPPPIPPLKTPPQARSRC
jgi:hypothetical protein